ncbi:MAG: hypothetical protein EA415_11745 [Sphaerobacteraceae bacterium]|nr:MAG: hypothetical protein EA415_11745 [Sphaerobacteraceae bacterium]
MRKLLMIGLSLVLSLGAFGGSALAEDENDDEIPDHRHFLLIHADIDAGVVEGFQHCTELAGGQVLPNEVHHDLVHFGTAGEALSNAGHLVLPGDPPFPYGKTCEDVQAFIDANEGIDLP